MLVEHLSCGRAPYLEVQALIIAITAAAKGKGKNVSKSNRMTAEIV